MLVKMSFPATGRIFLVHFTGTCIDIESKELNYQSYFWIKKAVSLIQNRMSNPITSRFKIVFANILLLGVATIFFNKTITFKY